MKISPAHSPPSPRRREKPESKEKTKGVKEKEKEKEKEPTRPAAHQSHPVSGSIYTDYESYIRQAGPRACKLFRTYSTPIYIIVKNN